MMARKLFSFGEILIIIIMGYIIGFTASIVVSLFLH